MALNAKEAGKCRFSNRHSVAKLGVLSVRKERTHVGRQLTTGSAVAGEAERWIGITTVIVRGGPLACSKLLFFVSL